SFGFSRYHVLDQGRFQPRARRMRARMDEYLVPDQLRLIRRHLVGEGRRRGARVRRILVAVPRACHAPIDDSPFSEWTVLVPANIGNRRDLAVVAEDGDTFAAQRHDLRALLRDVVHGTYLDETIPFGSGDF